MGQWSIHIVGHGIHDNGRDDDADALLADFLVKLKQHHEVYAATFQVGSTRHLPWLTERAEERAGASV